MADKTEKILELEKRLDSRLGELGFASHHQVANVVHRLAEVAVLGQTVASESVPLLVDLSAEHKEAMARVLLSIQLDVQEMRDAINDMEHDLAEIVQFLRRESSAA